MKSPVSGSMIGRGPSGSGGRKLRMSGFLSFYLNDSNSGSGEKELVGEYVALDGIDADMSIFFSSEKDECF